MSVINDLALAIDSRFPQNSFRGSRSFCEENAEGLLNRHFSSIEKFVYEDTLKVNQADSIVAYLRSMIPDLTGSFGEEFFSEAQKRIEHTILREATYDIPKRSAFFRIRL